MSIESYIANRAGFSVAGLVQIQNIQYERNYTY